MDPLFPHDTNRNVSFSQLLQIASKCRNGLLQIIHSIKSDIDLVGPLPLGIQNIFNGPKYIPSLRTMRCKHVRNLLFGYGWIDMSQLHNPGMRLKEWICRYVPMHHQSIPLFLVCLSPVGARKACMDQFAFGSKGANTTCSQFLQSFLDHLGRNDRLGLLHGCKSYNRHGRRNLFDILHSVNGSQIGILGKQHASQTTFSQVGRHIGEFYECIRRDKSRFVILLFGLIQRDFETLRDGVHLGTFPKGLSGILFSFKSHKGRSHVGRTDILGRHTKPSRYTFDNLMNMKGIAKVSRGSVVIHVMWNSRHVEKSCMSLQEFQGRLRTILWGIRFGFPQGFPIWIVSSDFGILGGMFPHGFQKVIQLIPIQCKWQHLVGYLPIVGYHLIIRIPQ
mmetsp:Transcript_26428/g.61505  ORF Transcript_26428/g.61505 Transcript_26428/m.61505 type:complete len:391 (+) Transcript_26428:538-1710(+)